MSSSSSSSDEAPAFFTEEAGNMDASTDLQTSASSSPASGTMLPNRAPVQQMQIPYEVVKKWTIVYPAYINASLKNSEGRRVALSKCEGCK